MKYLNIIATDMSENTAQKNEIQVGLSACLAGHEVRYNGGHTQSELCVDLLSKYFKFKTFCPEVAAGFDTPRPAMQLIGNPESPELVFSNNSTINLAAQLIEGFQAKLAEFDTLDGYIVMKNSPSCGLEKVNVYQANGQAHQARTMGLFTQAFKNAFPLVPIEEEGQLNDVDLFDNFLLRVYAHHNFRREVMDSPSVKNLIAFHSRYKYMVMAHNQKQYKALGRLLASHNKPAIEDLMTSYFQGFMQALAKPASRKNHTNTLLHILGYLKKSTPSVVRRNIVTIIYNYKEGMTPLTTPLTLLSHYLSQYGSDYIKAQRYLCPYPESIIHPSTNKAGTLLSRKLCR